MARTRRRGQATKRSMPRRRAIQPSRPLKGIKQGVGETVRRPLSFYSPIAHYSRAFDAFDHAHTPLPRATGPYAVVRMFQNFQSNARTVVIGPSVKNGAWYNVVAYSNFDDNLPVNNTDNATRFTMDSLAAAGFSNASVVPAAVSVQIMNPNALQTTSGIVFAGRAKNQLDLQETTDSWKVMASNLTSYTNPRIMAAAKLAMQGVQIDAVPMDMSDLANFKPVEIGSAGFGTVDSDIKGFAPIWLRNPNDILLQYLVCIEWRVRFDPTNPAHSSHAYHHPTTDAHFSNAISHATSVPVVRDIKESVAERGYSQTGWASRRAR